VKLSTLARASSVCLWFPSVGIVGSSVGFYVGVSIIGNLDCQGPQAQCCSRMP
jgi:hypothetical protein